MYIEYKRLTEKELDTFIEMRINQLREEGAKEEIDLVPALKEYYTHHMWRTERLYPGLLLTEKRLLEQAECHLWRNRHILGARVEGLDCCPACLQTRSIEERGLQGSCYPGL